jgi:ribosome-associated toxin RatA of RatAB toxin-antitoxin module
MKHVHKSVLVWHSAKCMFHLATDILAYPQFVPGCNRAQVLNRSVDGNEVQATLHLRLAGLSSHFSTTNIHRCDERGVYRVQMTLLEGPFKHLEGAWTFAPITVPTTSSELEAQTGQAMPVAACKVDLHLTYQFNHLLLAGAVSKAFDKLAAHLVSAFVNRANTLYGLHVAHLH